MSGMWPRLALGCLLVGASSPAFGQFTLPKPEVFVRAEDQQRARLITKTCTEADVGSACFRHDGRLIREAPCTYHVETGVIGSLPTDQCYKMEPARRYRGIWIDAFEGQQFIPEGAKVPEWPRGSPKLSEWRKKAERAIAATIWLDVEHAQLGHRWQEGARKAFIEFIGRKTKFPGNYGHMGMSGQEIIVDRVISLTECPKEGVCG
jgi:hypothetical protein